ncbi:MAG: diaminopimelate epimerase [Acidimicrobiales bacterium]
MTGTLELTKHHGLGNDFLVAFADVVPDAAAATARRLCDRRTGVGADGLIWATSSPAADQIGFTLFNSDGSPAEVSGNGLRCFGQAVARRRGADSLDVVAATAAGPRRVTISEQAGAPTVQASVEMGAVSNGVEVADDLVARLADGGEVLSGLGELRRWRGADVGNPHVVFDIAHLGAVEIARFGPAVEALLGPINVEVVTVNDRNHLDMVVWERGAGATQACGTGACASAHVAHQWDLVDERVKVTMPGGAAVVDLDGDQATLTGPSTYVARIEVPGG